MATLVCVPELGIAIANITIVRWAAREGQPVSRGEVLLEVQTDKMAMEIPAEVSGTVLKAFFGEEAQLTPGMPLAILGAPGEDIRALLAQAEAGLTAAGSGPARPEPPPIAPAPPREILASPIAKRIAREKGIDLAQVKPTGAGGRISQEDVLRHAAQREAAPPEPTDEVEVIPLKGARKVIAEHMVRSARTSPHYTLGIEADCTRLVALRTRLQDEFRQAHGRDLTYVPFMVKAMALAVRDVPIVNATVRDDSIAVQKVAHVGVAVAVDDLIFVPVVQRPVDKPIFAIAREVADLAQSARENRLRPEQARGGTITLTNMGIADVDIRPGTSILNQPEVANVIMGRIRDRVVPVDGLIGIRPILDVTFTYDHRVVMGIPGARFAERVKHYLENPEALVDAAGPA
jgi:pyruvate/2-oxoglutarate dehydrogenase complex dihydrolipoamide acyltransferase (E2) component